MMDAVFIWGGAMLFSAATALMQPKDRPVWKAMMVSIAAWVGVTCIVIGFSL